jgi:hypothetical protein
MVESTYQTEIVVPRRKTVDWSAIWAGLFVFAALWAVFEFLGVAIFGPPAQTGNIPLEIWTIVLTTAAMYFAGVETGKRVAVTLGSDAASHGTMMFGLVVVAGTILTAYAHWMAQPITVNALPAAHGSVSMWLTFIALFLGWIAAMAGAASAGPKKPLLKDQTVRDNVRDLRTAA